MQQISKFSIYRVTEGRWHTFKEFPDSDLMDREIKAGKWTPGTYVAVQSIIIPVELFRIEIKE